MIDLEESLLRARLLEEEAGRNRKKFDYTYDALPHLMTWPESHVDVARVISHEVDYAKLPFDEENEMYKGWAFKDQVKIVKANGQRPMLCEARGMQACLREGCPIYIAPGSKDDEGKVITKVPLCREFKIAFRKSSK